MGWAWQEMCTLYLFWWCWSKRLCLICPTHLWLGLRGKMLWLVPGKTIGPPGLLRNFTDKNSYSSIHQTNQYRQKRPKVKTTKNVNQAPYDATLRCDVCHEFYFSGQREASAAVKQVCWVRQADQSPEVLL